MTQEDKELLLKDLCARLLYGVNLSINGKKAILYGIDENTVIALLNGFDYKEEFIVSVGNDVDEIKPYLRSMSSMTDEEKKELSKVIDKNLNYRDLSFLDSGWTPWILYDTDGIENYIGGERFYFNDMSCIYDWLNINHFDYRGLIEKGLALEAPKNMYKTE